jgi:tetratricopeptide (TPR) repeat protein
VRAGPRWTLFIVFCLAVSGGVDLYPSVASAEEAATGQQAIAEAVSLLNQGKPKKAAQQLSGPMSSDDAYTEAAAQYYAGLCLRRLDRGKQAVGRWSRVEKPSSGQPATAHWYDKGRLAIARQLRRSGERRRAVSMYRDVLDDAALSANQAKAALRLGKLARRENQNGAARGFYEKGLALLEELSVQGHDPHRRGHAAQQLKRRLERRLNRVTSDGEDEDSEPDLPEHVRKGNERLQQAQRLASQSQYEAAVPLVRRVSRSRPAHPRENEATYRLGRYLLEAGERQKAYRLWERMLRASPETEYRPRILLDRADAALFGRFDVSDTRAALDRLAQALHEVAGQGENEADDAATQPSTTNSANDESSADEQPEVTAKDLADLPRSQYDELADPWQRGFHGMIERLAVLVWLDDEKQRATTLLERLESYPIQRSGRFSSLRLGGRALHERLLDVIRTAQFGVTDRPLPLSNRRDPRVGVGILLGELWFAAGEIDRAQPVFDAIAHGREVRPSRDQTAYAWLRLALCHFRRFDFQAAYETLDAVTGDARLSRSEWAAPAMLRRGIIAFSASEEPQRAIELMRRTQRHHPNTEEAVNAVYYIGVIYQWEGNTDAARSAYHAALDEYPDHERLREIVDHRLSQLE